MDDEHATLIDTGYATHAEQTLALVLSQLSGRSLSRILNTHLHSDHCGGNAKLQAAFPDTQIWIPPGHFDAVLHWDEDLLTYKATGQQCPRFVPHHVLIPGSSVESGSFTWEVHAAPGHDSHSVVLFEPQQKVLISADALWSNGFGVVFPELEGMDAFDEVQFKEQFRFSKAEFRVILSNMLDINGGKPTVQGVHLFSEAMRLAYADRDKYVADTDFVGATDGDKDVVAATGMTRAAESSSAATS
jgi:glyoxylase-like metal-dependent hydrolase (beta-lactamase superfamily II)